MGFKSTALALLSTHTILLLELREQVSTNQEKLNEINASLGPISAQFAKGLTEVNRLIDQLKVQAIELDFGPIENTIEQLQVAAEALDGIVPDVEAEDTSPTPVPVTPDEPPVPAGDLPPETPVVEVSPDTTLPVEVPPDAEPTTAGELDPTTPVVEIEPPDSGESSDESTPPVAPAEDGAESESGAIEEPPTDPTVSADSET